MSTAGKAERDPAEEFPFQTPRACVRRSGSFEGPKDSWRLASVFFLLLLCLGQQAFYKVDGQNLVAQLARGEGGHPLHPLFLPLAQVLGAIPLWLGFSSFHTLEGLSALGMALGVFCAHRLALKRFPGERFRPLAVALLVAAAPAVLFFGTVVEFHGLFFGAAGLFFLAWVRAEEHPSYLRFLQTALLSSLAAGLHATGHLLLLFVFLGIPKSLTPSSLGKRIWWILGFHGLFSLLLFLAFSPGGFSGTLDYLRATGREALPKDLGLSQVQTFALNEWILAFFPLSLLSLLSLFGQTWKEAWRFLLAVFLYLSFAFLPLGHQPEFGAYLLPLAIPGGLLAAAPWPKRFLPLLFLLSLPGFYLGLTQVHRYDQPRALPGFTQGYLECSGGKAHLYLGSLAEVDSLLRQRPDLRFIPFYEFLAALQASSGDPRRSQALIQAFLQVLGQDLAVGKPVFLGQACLDTLKTHPIPPWKKLRHALQTAYALQPIQARGFRAFYLLPRPPIRQSGGSGQEEVPAKGSTGR